MYGGEVVLKELGMQSELDPKGLLAAAEDIQAQA